MTQGQIRRQLKQVLYRHLQRKLRNNFKRRTYTCKHNRRTPVNGGDLGVCEYPIPEGMTTPTARFLCDIRILGGVQQAKQCPWWTPLHTKEEIKVEFQRLLESGNLGNIAAEYPDVAALMWVLGDQEMDLVDILSEKDGNHE